MKMPRKIFISALCVMTLASLAAVFSGSAAEAADELFVTKGGVPYVLERVAGQAADRYESRDGKAVFTGDGATATLTIEGKDIPRYVLIRDDGDGIILTADGKNYMMDQVETGSGAKYEVSGDPDTFFWSRGAAGMLSIGGNFYDGYGIWLPSGGIWLPGEGVPTGVEWRVRSIGGADVIDGSNVTLTFGADGRMYGVASVNNYSGSWMNVGNRIIMTQPVSTRKMGGEALMKQESAFFKALSDIAWFRPVRDGLELIAKDGGGLMLTR
jgi:heat shock protein HslJ